MNIYCYQERILLEESMFNLDMFIIESLKVAIGKCIYTVNGMGTAGGFNIIGFVFPLLVGKAAGDIIAIKVKRRHEKIEKIKKDLESKKPIIRKSYRAGE